MARRKRSTAAPLFAMAAAAYAANCALGASVAAGFVDTSGFRWLHHAMYIATSATVAAALSTVWWARPRGVSRSAALALAPAAIPLAAIPFAGTHTRRHPVVALAAAPFIAASLCISLGSTDRK